MPGRTYGDPFPELKVGFGPYRLFDIVTGGRRLDCRVCGRHIRRSVENALRHKAVELRHHTEAELRAILQSRLKFERSLKRKKQAQYQFAINPFNADKVEHDGPKTPDDSNQ